MNIAIIGVTGVVGRSLLEVLEEKNLEFDNIYAFASKNSEGLHFEVKDKTIEVMELSFENIDKCNIDVAIFVANSEVSEEYVPYLTNKKIVCIDNSSHFRLDDKVPLVVPEINVDTINQDDLLIANPNCSTIQSIVALGPLHKEYKIKRIVYSTYQAISGAGMPGIQEFMRCQNGGSPKLYKYNVASNCLPQIDVFLENGNTKEEEKLIRETKKILGDDSIKISATAVRVPVINCHSIAINVEFEKEIEIDKVKKILSNSEGIIVKDDVENNIYPVATDADGKNEVLVGRIRRDESTNNGLNMWVVADNIRKGAATNAVQILEHVMKIK